MCTAACRPHFENCLVSSHNSVHHIITSITSPITINQPIKQSSESGNQPLKKRGLLAFASYFLADFEVINISMKLTVTINMAIFLTTKEFQFNLA